MRPIPNEKDEESQVDFEGSDNENELKGSSPSFPSATVSSAGTGFGSLSTGKPQQPVTESSTGTGFGSLSAPDSNNQPPEPEKNEKSGFGTLAVAPENGPVKKIGLRNCRFFDQKGWCAYGASCSFRHVEKDEPSTDTQFKRPRTGESPVSQPKKKPRMCFNCANLGHESWECKLEQRCLRCRLPGHFARECKRTPKDSPTQYPVRPGRKECDYYQKNGYCRFGRDCTFNHTPKADPENFPVRPGRPECPLYQSKGICKFGQICKYNHTPPGQYGENVQDLPFQPGKAECPHYKKTGFCKFGANCIYSHTVDCPHFKKTGFCKFGANCIYSHTVDRALDESYAQELPVRPDEPECSYYQRTGYCRYGMDCSFNHTPKHLIANLPPNQAQMVPAPAAPLAVAPMQAVVPLQAVPGGVAQPVPSPQVQIGPVVQPQAVQGGVLQPVASPQVQVGPVVQPQPTVSNLTYEAIIPMGVSPGQSFTLLAGGQQVEVVCPASSQPGQKIRIQVPQVATPQIQPEQATPVQTNISPQVSTPQAAPFAGGAVAQTNAPIPQVPSLPSGPIVQQNAPVPQQPKVTKLTYEVVVPAGVVPGQPFSLLAGSQQVEVICPIDAQPGQKLRIEVPAPTTDQTPVPDALQNEITSAREATQKRLSSLQEQLKMNEQVLEQLMEKEAAAKAYKQQQQQQQATILSNQLSQQNQISGQLVQQPQVPRQAPQVQQPQLLSQATQVQQVPNTQLVQQTQLQASGPITQQQKQVLQSNQAVPAQYQANGTINQQQKQVPQSNQVVSAQYQANGTINQQPKQVPQSNQVVSAQYQPRGQIVQASSQIVQQRQQVSSQIPQQQPKSQQVLSPQFQALIPDTEDATLQLLTAFYQRENPEKVKAILSIVSGYKDDYSSLFKDLSEKYGQKFVNFCQMMKQPNQASVRSTQNVSQVLTPQQQMATTRAMGITRNPHTKMQSARPFDGQQKAYQANPAPQTNAFRTIQASVTPAQSQNSLQRKQEVMGRICTPEALQQQQQTLWGSQRLQSSVSSEIKEEPSYYIQPSDSQKSNVNVIDLRKSTGRAQSQSHNI